MEHRHSTAIWVDVEDFLHYFTFNARPGGIQSVSFEIMRALVAEAPGRIRFVRRMGGAPPLAEVAWAAVEEAYGRSQLADALDQRAGPPARTGVRRVVHSLPPSLRDPILHLRTWQLERGRLPASASKPAEIAPGDRLLVMGAPWRVHGFAEVLAILKQRHRLVPALLIHDLLAVRRPEWVGRGGANDFARFLHACLPLFDRLLSSSRHTADDVAAYAREHFVRIAPVVSIPVGNSFAPAWEDSRAPLPAGLPEPGSYVLLVSTLEPRKNHELAIRIWRRLIDDVQAGRRDPATLPDLVFAGRVGLYTNDLLAQLADCRWLDGRIRLIRNPTDAELHRLYAGCLFTLMPSWFEGVGLSVRESLAMGKPCLASSATALPEAGGALCRYFDPGDLSAAFAAVAALLDDPAGLAQWRQLIGADYQATPWAESARAILAHLDA